MKSYIGLPAEKSAGKLRGVGPLIKAAAIFAACFLMLFSFTYEAKSVFASDTEKTVKTGSDYESDIGQFKGKKVGVIIGNIYENYARDDLEASEILYYKNVADTLEALRGGKVDLAVLNKFSTQEIARETGDITTYNTEGLTEDVAFIFSKDAAGEELQAEINSYISEITNNGHLEGLQEKWLGDDTSNRTAPDLSVLTGENGTLTYATDFTKIPMDYMDDEGYKGFEVNLITEFCMEKGYGLEITGMDFDAIIPAVSSGKADIGGSSFAVTEERKESVLFSDKTVDGGGTIVLYTPTTDGESQGFFEMVAESFEKTFIIEGRWQLIVSGLLVTIQIAIFSAVFGTVFGFVLYFARKSKNRVLNGIAAVLMRIVQGVPMLVILMILYYVVFSASGLAGEWVAIVGFTITFGCTMAGILLNCIGAIDNGQWEACAALGFENRATFWKIILPQAMYQILPMYKGEFISLLKSTSIVGYIAVQDLTKASDIIRSRTFEAFFPIIATAVIYFLLAWALTSLLNLIEVRIDPERHKAKALKGIDTSASASSEKTGTDFLGEKGEELARFEHMEKRYANGGVPLKDINAVVRRGDVITIIGPSGTGKSTFMRCLNRLELHTKGEVYAFGKPVPTDKKELCKMRRRMGMVFQSFNLFPHLTVIENVMFAQVQLKGRSQQKAYEYSVQLLDMVGMGEKLLSYPGELSGGQKQRVAIARTLAMDPEIVLFDEPTSALDPTMVGQVLSVIKDLAKRGLTMMIVTHEMKFARDVSTRIFYLDQGQVYEEGSPDEIFDNPKRNRTRVFVQRLKLLKLEITSKKFDFVEAQEKMENFARDNYISRKKSIAIQRCFEEIIFQGLLPRIKEPFEINVLAEYSEEKEEAYLDFIYDGEGFNPMDDMDEISLSLVRAGTKDVSYNFENDRNQLRVTI